MPGEIHVPLERMAGSSLDERIDAICDDFESDWRRGERHGIRSYLGRCDQDECRQLFVELVLVELELRRAASEQPAWEDYIIHFPEFSEQIEAARFKDRSTVALQLPAYGQALSLRRVSHYELVQHIGCGAAGEVWKATDTRLRRTVAIKIPRRLLSNSELARFLREGQAAAQLSHPGIVSVFEVGRDGDTAYIASEYIVGESLRSALEHWCPTFVEAANFCRQLAEAIDSAHEQGVIHRDLKPGNVIVDQHRQPHVTDFGLAKWTHQDGHLTLDGELIGTPMYMSPEQARGDAANSDRRTDIYAIGVILYEMLTGRCPFEGDQTSVIYQINSQEPPSPRRIVTTIPQDLEAICLKAIEKSPSRRYPSALEMAADLRRFLRGDATFARPTGRLERGWRWIKRRPATTATIALACCVIVMSIVASRLAQKNHELLGLKMISIDSEPQGAQLFFMPLSQSTGAPILRQIRPAGKSPVRMELPAGEYLVVAVLDDGRFHEVNRRVPGEGETPGPYRHNYWRRENGQIQLSPIKIPGDSVPTNMVLVDAALYVDRHEFTVGQYRELYDGESPPDLRWVPVGNDRPVTVDFDRAVAIAEQIGKRLPSEAEYESALAATMLTAGVVNSATVYDLASGVAEWTTSRDPGLPVDSTTTVLNGAADYRIVRGGEVVAGNAVTPLTNGSRGPDNRIAVPRFVVAPNLGFRCVRSARPRFLNDR